MRLLILLLFPVIVLAEPIAQLIPRTTPEGETLWMLVIQSGQKHYKGVDRETYIADRLAKLMAKQGVCPHGYTKTGRTEYSGNFIIEGKCLK